jgi:hypothetical protein
MNSSRDQVAVGVDFEPLGNERALRFAWPVVANEEKGWALAEGWADTGELRFTSRSDLEPVVSLFDREISVSPPQGILVIGQGYVENALLLEEPGIAAIIVACRESLEQEGALLASGGHWCLPVTHEVYAKLAAALAEQAKRAFDDSVAAGHGAPSEPKAIASLEMFEAEPLLSYEDRVFRRLLYMRATKDIDALRLASEVAAERLGIAPEVLDRQVTLAFDVLREQIPFELAIRERARQLLLEEPAFADLGAQERLNIALPGLTALDREQDLETVSYLPQNAGLEMAIESGRLALAYKALRDREPRDIQEEVHAYARR